MQRGGDFTDEVPASLVLGPSWRGVMGVRRDSEGSPTHHTRKTGLDSSILAFFWRRPSF